MLIWLQSSLAPEACLHYIHMTDYFGSEGDPSHVEGGGKWHLLPGERLPVPAAQASSSWSQSHDVCAHCSCSLAAMLWCYVQLYIVDAIKGQSFLQQKHKGRRNSRKKCQTQNVVQKVHLIEMCYTCEVRGRAFREGLPVIGAVKILALPKRGGGSDPCQDFLVDL